MKKILVSLIAGALVLACGEKKETVTTAAPQPASAPSTPSVATMPAPPPAAAATAPVPVAVPVAAATTIQSGRLEGRVLETVDGAGYTYVKLATARGEEWAAVRQTKLKKGANAVVLIDMTAEKFESKTLNRTFDRITFGTIAGARPADLPIANASAAMSMAQMPKNHPDASAMMNAMGSPAEHMRAQPATGSVDVPKAEGADAKTIGEVWGAKAAFADKPVVVRGKVVKFLGGIMGTNWIHLRDGSGSAGDGTNDLTVTTNEMVAVGDLVVVRGTLRVDKDFGAGYRYAAIVENAQVTK